jgi:hypothetical protein
MPPLSTTGPVNITVDNPLVVQSPPGAWTAVTENLPPCIPQGTAVITSNMTGSSLSVTFAGMVLRIHPGISLHILAHTGVLFTLFVVSSPEAGKYSLSVNGGPLQIFDSSSASTTCGYSSIVVSPESTVRKRSDAFELIGGSAILRRDDSAQNTIVIKPIDGRMTVTGLKFAHHSSQ